MMERARREAPPNITIGELHSLLEATFGSQWTQDEEDELDRAMNDDPVVAALLDLSTGRHGGLWKATLYSVRETPDRRMSAPLRVSTRQHKALPQHGNMRNPNMNQMYCTHLILLVSHPIWERDIQALRQTIAFAVACQTKDQRPWNFENMVGGSVLAEFGRQAPASDGSRTIASLFRQVSNAAVGEKPPLVLLMDELAGDGDDDVEEGDFDDEAEVEYEVQLRHSASVIKVLDILVPRFKSSHTTSDWPAKQGVSGTFLMSRRSFLTCGVGLCFESAVSRRSRTRGLRQKHQSCQSHPILTILTIRAALRVCSPPNRSDYC